MLRKKTPESTLETVKNIFEERMNVNLTPLHAGRLGKPKDGQKRLILVKMKSFEEKLHLLKKARLLNGSGIYLMEDMSIDERKKRRFLVNRMKKARSEGKRAYIRYTDGELIINGAVYSMNEESNQSTCPTLVAEDISSQE